jgi:hypothetical protein
MKFIQAAHIKLMQLHNDVRGDNENLGRLLLLALVLIPLIILIAFFGQDILEKAGEQWDAVINEELKPSAPGG